MTGRFILAGEAERESLDWGELGWFSSPSVSGAGQLVVLEVNVKPGGGHNFHKHPAQEEVIYVLEGEIEQWVETERRNLAKGDSAFIPADTVHASFNTSDATAKLLAILGPSVGENGYELVDVAGEAPWKDLRSPE